MPKYRHHLPQLDGGLFLTDGGLETALIFHEGFDLPCFAAFTLLSDKAGRPALRAYYRRYIDIAKSHGIGFILESPTWRSSSDWGQKLGYTDSDLVAANRDAIDLMVELRGEYDGAATPVVISGCIGPRGDGYDPGAVMSPAEAEAYHGTQIRTFAKTEADLVTAVTMTNTNEAIGVTSAAKAAGLPVVISFTLETDGRLPTGQGLAEAIQEVDQATGNAPAYFMINCAHPTHFEGVLAADAPWLQRIRGLRANASTQSHAELDQATELDDGDPVALGQQHARLLQKFGHFRVLGGCCGTDHRHVEQICGALKAAA